MTDPDPDYQQWLGERRHRENAIDIGHDHYVTEYTGASTGAVRIGAHILHRAPNGLWCMGSITYDIPEAQPYRKRADGGMYAAWALRSRSPLHVEPSVLCSCGDHGFIRNGRWEPA